MSGGKILDSWENFELDDWNDDVGSQNVNNADTPVVSKAIEKKLEEQRIEREFADELFDDLLGDVNTEPVSPRAKTGGKKATNDGKKEFTDSDEIILLDVNNAANVEKIALVLAEKLQKTKLKSGIYYRFIDVLLNICREKMSKEDMRSLQNKFRTYVDSVALSKSLKEVGKRKPNVRWDVKNYEQEMDIVYGGEMDDDYSDEGEYGMDGF